MTYPKKCREKTDPSIALFPLTELTRLPKACGVKETSCFQKPSDNDWIYLPKACRGRVTSCLYSSLIQATSLPIPSTPNQEEKISKEKRRVSLEKKLSRSLRRLREVRKQPPPSPFVTEAVEGGGGEENLVSIGREKGSQMRWKAGCLVIPSTEGERESLEHTPSEAVNTHILHSFLQTTSETCGIQILFQSRGKPHLFLLWTPF